jgi:hypothetical protein
MTSIYDVIREKSPTRWSELWERSAGHNKYSELKGILVGSVSLFDILRRNMPIPDDIIEFFLGKGLAMYQWGHVFPLLLLLFAVARCSMAYPDAYCIKCKTHTDTLGKHTIILGKNRRALKGVCPICATETYRFMPNKDEKIPRRELSVISSIKRIDKGSRVSVALPTTTAKRLDRYGRATPSQELYYYGSLLVGLGLLVAVSFILITRIL